MNWKKQAALILSVTILSGLACSPADRRLSLRDSLEAPGAPLSPEAARVHQLQLVRYVDDEGFSWEVTADDFGKALSDCEGLNQCQFGAMSACERAACTLKMKQCEGELMLAIASGTGSALKVNLDWQSGANATVPPQSAATNAALAEQAAVRFRDAMKYATDILMGVFPYPLPPCTDLGASFDEYSGERPLRDFAAATFLDSFHEGKRAYHVAFKNTLAVSDAELSSAPSLELGRVRAISNDRLSRTAAAHLMVPGVSGWLGSNSEAFCTSGKLTGPQEAALAVLREAAPAPSDVLSRDTDLLLHGSETETQFGTIRERLADAWGVDALPATKPLWEAYGLTRNDFAAAHAALKDELQIFARTGSAILPARRIPGGVAPQFQRFAGTAGQAPERPDHYWASLSQLGAAESPVPEEFWMLPNSNLFDYFDGWAFSRRGPGETGLSMAEFVEVGYAWARVITQRTALSTFPDTVLNPLRLLLSGEDTRGRLTHCVSGPSSNMEHDISVAGFDASDRLALVRGEDLMECAVNGHIEGANCSLPDFLQGPPSLTTLVNPDFSVIRLNYELPFQVGPYESVGWAFFTVTNPNVPPTALGRYYLIRPKQKGDDTPRPGEWELLLGTPLVNDPSISGTNRCRIIPIVPEATEAAASAIAPSRDWCGTSEVSCAGTRFDERLPLEDELTGDGDDIESSWKHYLELARSAVDQADALGQEYIEASLNEDLRTEVVEIRRDQQEEKAMAAFQRVQEICGSAVKPETVLFLLGFDTNGNLDLNDIGGAQCTTSSSGPPVCGVRRLLDQNAELGELRECLGFFGDLKETHLGDGFLCIANPDTMLPEGAPRIRVVEDCVTCLGTTGYRCLTDKDGLGLFDTKSLQGNPPLPDVCEGVQRLRAPASEVDEDERRRMLEAVTKHVALSRNEITGLPVEVRLDYDEASGSYVKVNVGSGWSVSSKKQDSELCSNADTDCATGFGGLFCKTWNCNDPARQGELNLRLYRAGLALMNAVPEATPESGLPARPPLRVDSLWYLNYYLQPLAAWGEQPDEGQWRVFVRPERKPWGKTLISVPQGVQAPVFLGQAWNAEGPTPELRILGTNQAPNLSTTSPLADNKPMQLALRNAYLIDQDPDKDAEGLRLDLFTLVGAEGMHTTTVQLEPVVKTELRPNESEKTLGLGVLAKQYADDCTGCQLVADLNYKNLDVEGFVTTTTGEKRGTASDLKLAVETDRWLSLFPPPSPPPTSDWVAPAAQAGTVNVATHTRYGVQVFPPPPGSGIRTSMELDGQAELDAVELACRGAVGMGMPLEADCGEPQEIREVRDLPKVGHQLQCIGNLMKNRAATAIYRLPQKAREYLSNGERVYDATGGALHVAISDLRNSLLQASISGPVIGGTLQRFGSDLNALHAQLARGSVGIEIDAVQLTAGIAQQSTNCMTSLVTVASLDFVSIPGRVAAGAGTCMNSFAQIGFMEDLFRLQNEERLHESQEALAQFSSRAHDYVTTLSAEGIRLSQALEGIQRNLEVIEGLKAEGLRAMQTAVWHLSTQSFNQGAITRSISNLKVGKGIRYQRAFDNAKRMAFLAKRSIEMRLGMSLAEMVQDLPLVAAPSTWEGSVCQATGINYVALRDKPGGGETFADAFLGDYVTKLEQVIESYRLVNNFHEGTDTVVVSLRDDIHNTRARCASQSRNLLYWASDLVPAPMVRPQQRVDGWTQTGCVMESGEDDDGPFERPAGNCIVVREREDTPFFDPILGVRPVPAWDLEFGLSSWCGSSCAFQAEAAISQDVDVGYGRYRFSWYTSGAEGSGDALAGRAWNSDGFEIPMNVDPGGPTPSFVEGLDGDWNRAFFEFDVAGDSTIRVGFVRPSAADPSISIAAPMLEKLEDPEHTFTLREPPAFTDTTWERVSHLPVCEDTTGRSFRKEKWHRHCQKLCPDGYASDCAARARTECYWETSFHVSQRSIEAGHMFNQSGFARGNYNYRLQRLGLNFVGTNLRACGDSSLPATCNAAGYIPYSVIHDGPYYVRNHKGRDYRAALFPGRIEHARGLGVERYISNPLGEADRALIGPYMRSELIGRPLDGEFIIRVWDEDGVNFGAIEDVQLVIDYGYWTRFN